jgi:ornithine carbamoyltransferase
MSLVGVSPELASWSKRDFLKELDHTGPQLLALVELAAELKAEKRGGNERRHLVGRNIALVFEKTSTRTRCAFEVGAHDQGAFTTYLDPSGSQIGHKESPADTARVLSRMFDGIQYRGASQAVVEELAAASDVPVYNGLTDDWHPTQMLADVLTMLEYSHGPARELSYAYLGDARFNMGRSLLITGALIGADVRLVAPRAYWPEASVVETAQALAINTGARVTLTEDLDEGLRDAQFVHTDVWVSMGEAPEVWEERVAALAPYQVNAATLARTARVDTKFLHCLPAYHDRGTVVGRAALDRFDTAFGLGGGLEVTDEVFQSAANVCFDQAENRLHTIKALLVATLA